MIPASWFGSSNLLSGGFSATTALQTLILSYVFGQAIAWLYIWTHRGLSFSRNMIHALVLLSMIVGMVMLVVGDSIARAFGLVGALAIIRFRTVVRDARDTTFIFLALSVGISVGAQQVAVAFYGTVVIGLVAAMLHFTGFAAKHTDAGVMRVRSVAGLEALDTVLGEWCRTHALLAQREASGELEYSFEVRLYNPDEKEELVRAIRGLAGTSQVTVTMEERAEEW